MPNLHKITGERSGVQPIAILASQNFVFQRSMDFVSANLCRVISKSAAVSALLAIKPVLAGVTRHGGKIKVQRTSIARRLQNIIGASKRVPAVRPTKVPASKRV